MTARMLVLCVALAPLPACMAEVDSAEAERGDDAVGATRAAIGEPMDGFPNWHERVVHVWTNRARAEPAADLASCGATCGERACYSPVAPLAWGHDLARLARFHSENLSRMGCSLMHDSPCTLVSNIGALYTPGSCNGAASCACSAGGGACGGAGSTGTFSRFDLFGVTGGARAENIAGTGTDPVSTFYLWLHEPYASTACGWSLGNGHRHSILNGTYRSVGVGRSDVSPRRMTQDFQSSGSPAGLVAGVHYPAQAASVEMRANWYDGSAPDSAQVNVEGDCTAMTLERGSATNGTYLASVSGVGSGCHRYYFHYRVGSTDYFHPTTGSFGIGCAADWDATRPAACGACTPSCGGRECGGDGCGGSCGSCGPSEDCTAGTCVATCTPDCSGAECGDDGCGGSCGSCASGRACDGAGTCACSSGRTECGGNCVNTNRSRSHCGACGAACAANEDCVGGSCTCVPDCTGRTCGDDGCSGSCGSCGGGRVCAAGDCACSGGLSNCGGECVDVRVDGANCGACGTTCGAGESCRAGTCSADVPDAGCEPACDGRSCGDDTCGGTCGACASGEVCGSGGICACADESTACGGACVDTRVDTAHCGACDAPCAGAEVCLAGMCTGADPDAGTDPDADAGAGDGGSPPPAMSGDAGPTSRDPLAADDTLVTGSCGCVAPGRRGRAPLAPALLLALGALPLLRRRRR